MRGWFKVVILAALLLFIPSLAFGQAGHFESQVVNAQGRPVGGATIRVCTSAWTGTAISSCTPTASIF